MAKVSLRIYNREIEGLIDQGQTDEAIAHCRHILKTFPKHLETYRLLGKAYLEARRYSEAVDIFSRVLNSVPEDFVAHVGMSIINDEQNQLDNAIWHMERAFEAQPSNAAIQGELQRLYGRRDGMEPPKVRMTRGALAHMYVQGELYPQAIAEIKAVLAQDAQRTDLQVLLARAYFKSGQKNDATELCSFLLKKAPYCFDANRIMVEALHANASASESTQGYRLRVGELDPYANFSKESVFRSNEVADAAINLERLEYSGQEVPIGQEWSSSLGINLGEGAAAAALTASSAEPDWLKSASAPEADIFGTAQPLEAQSAQPAEDIPDFLRAAGWGASSGPEQPTSFFDSEDATPNSTNEDLVSASIPDWLKGQMPVESTPPVAMDMSATEAPVADEDWLNNLTTAAQKNSQASHGEMPDWLSGSDNSASESVASSEPATKNADVPDWLSGLDDTKTESAPVAETQSNNDVPDWLAGLDKEEPAQTGADANVPDWLSGLDDSASTPEATPQSAPNIESLGASAQEQDDAVAWLESLAAKHGAKPEELVTDPNKRS
ncbi:MAG: tetratricopeptide repeat protein, partial [Anaerolineales bacterium]|nr:tetratricopeptide repeat protein [Anaerolineales bacterium]